jgi:thioredoxin 1
LNRIAKAGVVAALLAIVALAAGARQSGTARAGGPRQPETPAVRRVPRLVDLGADKCIPCKAMAPILQQLRADYAGRLEVTFVDVWKSPEQAEPFGVRMIPTQIFFAADGRELSRHQGFMSREEILEQWKALGVEL